MKKSTLHSGQGFTLVEMLVVVAVIAVLVAIVVGVSGLVLSRASIEQTKVNMQVIRQALDAYLKTDDSGNYPPATGNLFVLLKGNTAAAKKLASLPDDAIKDTGSGDCFVDGFEKALNYSPDGGAGGTPALISAGNDGKYGTDDERPAGLSGREWEYLKRKWQADNVRSDNQ